MEGPIDVFGPSDLDSLEFQARCQIRRIQLLTGESRSQVVCRAVGEYYQRVLAGKTDEELQKEQNMWREQGFSATSAPVSAVHSCKPNHDS